MSTPQSWQPFLPRKSVVMAKIGSPPRARLAFVGESLDASGTPACELLDKMIEAMGVRRSEVCLTSGDVLVRQLAAIQPEVVVALGTGAAQALLQTESSLAELRGRFHDFRGIKVRPTFHPSDLLKHPASKKEAWADLQAVAKELGLEIPTRKNAT